MKGNTTQEGLLHSKISNIFKYRGSRLGISKRCRGEVGQMKWMDESGFHLNQSEETYCTSLQYDISFVRKNLPSDVESAAPSPDSVPPYSVRIEGLLTTFACWIRYFADFSSSTEECFSSCSLTDNIGQDA